MSAVTIKRTQKGTHPVKLGRWGYDKGQPLPCYADVLAIINDDRIAVSMNGTAVFTPGEFQSWAAQVLMALGGEDD